MSNRYLIYDKKQNRSHYEMLLGIKSGIQLLLILFLLLRDFKLLFPCHISSGRVFSLIATDLKMQMNLICTRFG